MSNKSKGSNAERELYEMFVSNGFRAVRVAGSGRMDNADCDLIAGKKNEKYAIEAKSSKKPVKYITKEQIENFMVFSEIFDLVPVIAVRFNRLGWFFINPKDLEDSGKYWVVNMKIIKEKGKRFAQFFSGKNCDNNNADREILEDYMKEDYEEDDDEEIEEENDEE
jgi:Holliday junction resolvase